MERFIVCKNALCRLVVDLRTQDNRILKISELIINQCPECGSEWSSHCPFCANELDANWHENLPICSQCLLPLKADRAGSGQA